MVSSVEQLLERRRGRKCGRVKGGNDELDRSGPLHGAGGGQRDGLGAAACEEDAVLGRCR
jgi:hypothetical protein